MMMLRKNVKLGFTLLSCLIICVPFMLGQKKVDTVAQQGRTYDFREDESRTDWVHITEGDGNEYTDSGSRITNMRGRSFLLNINHQPRDLTIEVKAKKEYGPAYAWILPRFKDANNYYEIVLKEGMFGVCRRHHGKYTLILEKKEVDLGDNTAPHLLKVKMVGEIPTITVWIDDKQLWTGKDETGLGILNGDFLALETEFSMVTIQKVTIDGVK